MKDKFAPGSVHIIGGGTISHVRPHLALCAPAYGQVVRDLQHILAGNHLVLGQTHFTRMASPTSRIETNEDVAQLLDDLVADPKTRIIFMAAAICDFTGETVRDIRYDGAFIETEPSGKDQPRLKTTDSSGHPLSHLMVLRPADKILSRVRKTRKDIFLVGFKTTAGATPDEQYLAGLRLLKTASCNLVLANDVHTRLNMVITPEQARYHETEDRHAALAGLVEMALLRAQGTFTRSTIIPGDPVPWTDPRVPSTLRTVVDWCVAAGAYKPFLGSTVGHFAVKVTDGTQGRMFLTSRRKTNFNDLYKVGLCAVYAKDDGTHVESVGGPPSVGGQSQRIIFTDHPDTDCIVHFHCPRKASSEVPLRSQRENECGSHQCGKNTSSGLKRFNLPNGQYLYAVMLDKHGPNIVFSKDTNPYEVIRFIENNFDLAGRTDDLQTEASTVSSLAAEARAD